MGARKRHAKKETLQARLNEHLVDLMDIETEQLSIVSLDGDSVEVRVTIGILDPQSLVWEGSEIFRLPLKCLAPTVGKNEEEEE